MVVWILLSIVPSEQQAKIYDSQNGGNGTAHTHTFDNISAHSCQQVH